MSQAIADLLSAYPIVSQLPVQWGEMDANLHVNNVVYLRWAETGRLAYFQQIEFLDFTGKEVGPILGKASCKYIFPLVWPDQVWIGTRTTNLQSDRFTLETGIFSEKHARIAALVSAEIVVYDYQQKQKAIMPNILRDRIFELEASAGT